MKIKLIILMLLAALLLTAVACTTGGEDETQKGTDTSVTDGETAEPTEELPPVSESDPADETNTEEATPPESTEEPNTEEATPSESTEEPNTEEATPSVSTEEPTVEPETELPKPAENYQILFIGNSYTYYNNMPESIFLRILRAAGMNGRITAITKGGWYLIDSADPADEVGSQVENMLAARDFDYVILQEQSTCPALSPGKFYEGVRILAEKLRADGATPILYGTWGRKEGHSVLAENGWTNETMTWKIAAGYEAIGAELDIDVAYAGLAFYDVYTHHSEIELYDADKTHPSPAGSYLAAMTLFATITGVDPTTVDYDGDLDSETAAILREAARKAVFETPEIPAEYKTSSEGVVTETPLTVDDSACINLTKFPTSELISVLKGGEYPNGKSFSGILGTKGAISSKEFSVSGLTNEQKADIADIGYGVSVIGIERMTESANGHQTAVENLVNGHWGTSFMASFEFDEHRYNINGKADDRALYTGLITLNFGSKHKFDTIGFASGSLEGFPGVAEVFVSDDGENWTRVPTACWDTISGTPLVNCGTSPKDPWNNNTAKVTCLFDMAGVSGQYIRIGVVIGRSDEESKYNTVNTREVLVYGEKAN